MALQDLTPQLRTRLSRMERAVGVFVLLAGALLVFGFGYYVYNTAQRKGWFLTKARYYTFVRSADGLRVGDPVKMMGFDAGRIIRIEPMPAEQFAYNVFVQFELKDPNYDYIWTEGSAAEVKTADFLGKRVLEVTKGVGGHPTYTFFPMRRMTLAEAKAEVGQPWWVLGQDVFDASGSNLVAETLEPLSKAVAALSAEQEMLVLDQRERRGTMTGVWNDQHARYEPWKKTMKGYWLIAEESPPVTERLQEVVSQVQQALPGVFSLTNQLGLVLSNTAVLTANLAQIAADASPAVSNLTAATAELNRPGALGEWLIPTNINRSLDRTLGDASTAFQQANRTFETANTNLAALSAELGRSLENLSGVTSNLNSQVQGNTNLLESISRTIIHADQLVQGLKRHWLLRSAFREKPNPAPAKPKTSPTTNRTPAEPSNPDPGSPGSGGQLRAPKDRH